MNQYGIFIEHSVRVSGHVHPSWTFIGESVDGENIGMECSGFMPSQLLFFNIRLI